jgi:hypothetical protein
MLLTQPTCKVAHARRRPNLITGSAMCALERIKERGSQFSIRRKNSAARRSGSQ